LLLLPYAIQHPGVSVGELARKFDVDKRDLLDDLQLVFMCGLPGYGPGDLIDVDLDEDRVYIRMADYFAAPLRLSPAEALVLYAGTAALAALPGMEEADALKSALVKLHRALGGPADEGASTISIALEPAMEESLGSVRRAITDRKQVAIEYFSQSRGELTQRNVEPWGLIAALGRWYLVGQDHLSGEERMFRLDRMKTVSILDEPAEIPDSFDPESYRGGFHPTEDEPTVSFEISPAAARWFREYYPVNKERELSDGWSDIELVAGSPRWAATLVLQLGDQVRNVRPAEVVEQAEEMAERLVRAHS
jgi:proteasome accessory factor C